MALFGHNAFASDDISITQEEITQLDSLKSMKGIGDSIVISSDPLAIRGQAIREAAVTVGIQGGIKWRYSMIDRAIERIASDLDRIYDFQPLLIQEKIFAPIITEANNPFGLKDDGSATSSTMSFEIISDARIVAQQPSWRDYLIHNFDASNSINPLLKPKTDEETAAWHQGVSEGWSEGVKIADRMSVENINRLTRDYRGAIRFHMLAQQGVITMPTLSIGDLGVRVNGKKLDINQRIFRITAPTEYKVDTKDWKALSGKQIEWDKPENSKDWNTSPDMQIERNKPEVNTKSRKDRKISSGKQIARKRMGGKNVE